jgi:hypothetical protein
MFQHFSYPSPNFELTNGMAAGPVFLADGSCSFRLDSRRPDFHIIHLGQVFLYKRGHLPLSLHDQVAQMGAAFRDNSHTPALYEARPQPR